MSRYLTRDRLALLAAFAAPPAFAAILVPFRASFPNTDAALAMLLVMVAVAAAGNRLAGYFAALSSAVWFDFFLTQPYERFTITRHEPSRWTVVDHGFFNGSATLPRIGRPGRSSTPGHRSAVRALRR
jgi:K+-sensing histidine kinase KdpD